MNLLRASAKGDLAAVKKFVAEGGNVNAADPSGRTPIIEASWAGHAEVVKYLADKSANINTVDGAGYTALMRACEEGHAPVVTYLLTKGANVNAHGKVRGTTPLMLAAERGHLKIIELLLNKGAKINAVNQQEETALAYAYHALLQPRQGKQNHCQIDAAEMDRRLRIRERSGRRRTRGSRGRGVGRVGTYSIGDTSGFQQVFHCSAG
jgi:hypothetical protein